MKAIERKYIRALKDLESLKENSSLIAEVTKAELHGALEGMRFVIRELLSPEEQDAFFKTIQEER